MSSRRCHKKRWPCAAALWVVAVVAVCRGELGRAAAEPASLPGLSATAPAAAGAAGSEINGINPPVTPATGMTAQQIVDAILQQNVFGFDNAVARLTLTLLSRRGGERVRQVEVRTLRAGGLNRTLVRFDAPAEVAGTSFLLRETGEGDDTKYLYLPAIGKVKRISGQQRHQKFMGTDLTYADLESRSLRDAAVTRLPDAVLGGHAVYVIEALPTGEDRAYSKTIAWVHPESFVPLQIEYYDRNGVLEKTLRVRRLEKNAGRWVAAQSRVDDVQRHTSTEMRVDTIDFGIRLTDSDFTPQALVNG